ncbi:energy transducer TonB [Hymenobacter chitinivorans]|uniref:energy transducer TonB n=1 Tax=Hymenobacter chitinivorans TaxID=89969 RepID=UPI001B806607|nr:energy transducer TonB [Hymenobacter chitinivorans]
MTLGEWTFKSWGPLLILLLASGLLGGIRARLKLTRSTPLSTIQAILVGIAAPLLISGLDNSTPSDVAYSDSNYTVTINTHESFQIDNLIYTDVELYRTHGLLFEKPMGKIVLEHTGNNVPERMEWWHGVSALSFDPSKNRGVARHNGQDVPFEVNPPYHNNGVPPPEPPAEPVVVAEDSVDDNKVYTYVEEMPKLLGYPGKALTLEVAQAVLVWLKVPRDAQEGTLFLGFVVDKTGAVRNLHIAKGLSASSDSAVLAAARHMPSFSPGRMNGKPLNVSLTVPIQVYKSIARRGKRNRH